MLLTKQNKTFFTSCISSPVTDKKPTESVSSIVEGSYQGKPTKLIYGVFTTPENAIGGNAICAFKVLKFPFLFDGV